MTDQASNEQNQQPTEPTPSVLGAPESIDGYEVNIEGFDFDEFKAIEENQQFLDGAREAGLDNKALNFVLDHYNQLLPKLMEGNAVLENEATVQAMKEVWGDSADTNFKAAYSAAQHLVNAGIATPEEIDNPANGNNPFVLKMAAYFGSQLREDTPPSNTQQNGATDIQSLMQSEAYLNENHPDHKRVYGQVQNFYLKQFK